MEHIDETKHDTHPQAHAVVKKAKSTLPPLVVELGLAVTAGWTMYLTMNDWKQGVSAFLFTLFGNALHRGSAWWLSK